MDDIYSQHLSRDDNPHKTTAALAGSFSQAQVLALLRNLSVLIDAHIANINNPHQTDASLIGLGNVTNESKTTMFHNPTFTGLVQGITKAMVGLGSVVDIEQMPLSYLNNSGTLSNSSVKVPSDYTVNKVLSSLATGLQVIQGGARVATTANITLSGTQTIDGVALSAEDVVLVWKQTDATENGIWVVKAGAWERSTLADAWEELMSAYVLILEGTTYTGAGFYCTVGAGGVIGTTPVDFTLFSLPGSYTSADALADVTMDTISDGTTYKKITAAEKTNFETGYNERNRWDGGSGGLVAATGRTSLALGTAAVEADTKYNHRANSLNDVASAATARTNLGAAADADVVKLAGAQTVNGIKTFGSIPVLPITTPSTDNQAARKKYVDDTVAAGKTTPIITVSTSRDLANSDFGAMLVCTNSSAITLTIPASLMANFKCGVTMDGTGTVTVSPASGVTLNSDTNKRLISTRYTPAAVLWVSSDIYRLYGRLSS